jgi:hypothetical protein
MSASVDRAVEQAFEIKFQPHKALEGSLPTEVREFDEKVEVAPRRIKVSTRRGTKEFQARHTVLPAERLDLGQTLFNNREHGFQIREQPVAQ